MTVSDSVTAALAPKTIRADEAVVGVQHGAAPHAVKDVDELRPDVEVSDQGVLAGALAGAAHLAHERPRGVKDSNVGTRPHSQEDTPPLVDGGQRNGTLQQMTAGTIQSPQREHRVHGNPALRAGHLSRDFNDRLGDGGTGGQPNRACHQHSHQTHLELHVESSLRLPHESKLGQEPPPLIWMLKPRSSASATA